MDNRKKSPLDVEYTSGGIFNAKKLMKKSFFFNSISLPSVISVPLPSVTKCSLYQPFA